MPSALSAGTAASARSSAPRSALKIPSPVNGSKKSAASPTSAAPSAMTLLDDAAKGPVTMTARATAARSTLGPHLGELLERLEEERLRAAAGGARPGRGNHQRDVGAAAADRVEPDISLDGRRTARPSAPVPDTPSRWATNPIRRGQTVPVRADAPCDDRSESVGADGEPCPNRPPAAVAVPHDCASHRAAIVHQLLDRGALEERARPLERRHAPSAASRIRRETERPVGRKG